MVREGPAEPPPPNVAETTEGRQMRPLWDAVHGTGRPRPS